MKIGYKEGVNKNADFKVEKNKKMNIIRSRKEGEEQLC